MGKAAHKITEVETDIRESHTPGGRSQVSQVNFQSQGVVYPPDEG